jgi:hypothetical protein
MSPTSVVSASSSTGSTGPVSAGSTTSSTGSESNVMTSGTGMRAAVVAASGGVSFYSATSDDFMTANAAALGGHMGSVSPNAELQVRECCETMSASSLPCPCPCPMSIIG